MIVVLEWITIVILVLLSGLFSGLNLGLMGLDKNDLECIMSGENEANSANAKKIKPLREYGNWLLCTLLLGNVAVNTALSILLAQKTEAVIGFVLSTIVIVVFGEIIPQALCSRYALWIGAKTANFVWVLMIIMALAAYPIALILDKLLGKELGTIYSPAEFKQLINIHAKDTGTTVNTQSANIMKGALELHETQIKDVMTKIEDVFWLNVDTKLTFDVLTQIFKSGHSRIPIMKKTDFGNNLQIVGMLYAKDLILLDPDDEIPVLHIMNAFKYEKPFFLSSNTRLDRCLRIFVASRQHLCMVKEPMNNQTQSYNEHKSENNVSDNNNNTERGPLKMSYFDEYLQNQNHNLKKEEKEDKTISIGIITLEDVIEHALQTELVDEHDVFINIRSHEQTNRLSRIDWSMLQMFDHRQKILTSLPPQELQAVYNFFSHSIKAFMPNHRKCSESSIKNLLVSSSVVRVDVKDIASSSRASPTERTTQRRLHHQIKPNRLPNNDRDPYKDIENNGLLLYQRDTKTEYFTLILDGKCEIYAGRQGFKSILSRWTYLCPDALDHVQQCVVSGKPLLDYVPDFTCKVITDTRVLRIKLADFRACLQGKFEQMQNDHHQFTQQQTRGFSEPVIINPKYNHNNNCNTLTIPGSIAIPGYNYIKSEVSPSETDQSGNHKPEVSPKRLMYINKKNGNNNNNNIKKH